ncbi:hypothetical protein ACQPUZ_01340 [Clostridium tertium]
MKKSSKFAVAVGTIMALALSSSVYFFTISQKSNDIKDKENSIVQNDIDDTKLSVGEESNSNDTINKDGTPQKDESNANNSVNLNTNNNINTNSHSSGAGQESITGQDANKKPEIQGESEKPGNIENQGDSEKPNEPGNSEKPGKPSDPENPGNDEDPDEPGDSEKPNNPGDIEKPEIVINDITITNNDLVNGVATISNKEYKNIYIDSSVSNGKIVLDNVKINEKLILKDGVQYQVEVKNSTVPYVKVENNEEKMYRDSLSIINKNISGPTLYLENVKEIDNVDVDGNISILGNGKISNLNIQNGILVIAIPTEFMNIDKNSNNVDITINGTVSEINDNGNGTSIGVNSKVNKINSNGEKSNIYIKEGAIIEQATINGDSTKIMGNGTLNSVEINGSNAGVYTKTPEDNIQINQSASNTFVGREEKYEISNINLKQQGVIEFTLNEATSRPITLEEISVICHGGNTMSVFNVSTTDNKTYTLNTSYYKDNTYEIYITLPNKNIISKEFDYSYNHPTASKVSVDRTSATEATIDIYGVDEGGYLYYKLVEKNILRYQNNVSVDEIKENGTKVAIKTEYNEILISNLEENKEYDLYYVMEAYDGRTSPVYGPVEIGIYEDKQEDNEYKLDYAAEEEVNKFVFTFNKPVNGELKLEDFSIICPTESALTTKGAKFSVSSDKKTYTIIVPDNYGHKDNKYTVSVNMPDGSVVNGSFRSHFNPPSITGDYIDHYSQNKIKFEFNSDEHGTLYYGVYESNNSVVVGDSTTPMAEDVLSGKVNSTKAVLNSGYNELDIDLSGYNLTNKSRLWVLFVDYDGNYRKGFVDHFKIPEFIAEPDGGEEDKSSLDITNIEIDEGWMGTLLELTFNEDLTNTFGQNDIKLQSLSGVNLPGKIGMSVSFPSDKQNYASIEFMGLKLSAGEYRITIKTYDSKDRPVEIIKEFTVK